MIKKQLQKLIHQLEKLNCEETEEILTLSLVDKDLEQLVSLVNQQYQMQRKTVANALRHEDRQRESIANIAHDLRTPLTVINGHLQILQGEQLSVSQQERVVAALNKAHSMKELIESFYELSLLENETFHLTTERINFTNLLQNFLTDNAILFEKEQFQPNIKLSPKTIYVDSDTRILERIMQNLLVNALRYSTGEISIALTATKNMNLTIENSIDSASHLNVERLFERFYTGDRSRSSGSSGVGLAVVKLLTEKISGTISATIHDNRLAITLTLPLNV